MRKRFCIVLAIVVVAIIGWFGWKTPRSPEPSYQGRRLSEWLDDYNHAVDLDKTGPASEAIRAMGTNTLPFLLANIKHTDSPLAQKFVNLVRKQHLVKFPFYGADRFRKASMLALSALGSNAAPLFPRLLKFSDDARNFELGTLSLLAIGPSSIPTLAKLCQSTNEDVRRQAVFTILTLKVMPRPGFSWGWEKAPVNGRPIFVLYQGIPETDHGMVELLEDPDAALRRASADYIARYAKPPYNKNVKLALVKAVNDPDAAVRLSAGKALKAIDPIVASKAGVK